jgi:hypothetical protein
MGPSDMSDLVFHPLKKIGWKRKNTPCVSHLYYGNKKNCLQTNVFFCFDKHLTYTFKIKFHFMNSLTNTKEFFFM